MVLFSLLELFYLLIATLVVGYIFSGFIKKPSDDPLAQYHGFNWNNYWFAVQVAAPGIILHELAHKFVAMGFGLHAAFQIWPTGLFLGALLKFFGSGFTIIAPGYVTIFGATPFISSLTALAGPLTNAALWLTSLLLLKYAQRMQRSTAVFFALTKEINKWLFIFNMIPIPPLDGFNVIRPLLGI